VNFTAATVSYAQQSLWLQAELEPGNPAYHVPVALRLRGDIDTAALTGALNALTQRHEVLRTTFAVQEGELLQVIHPQMRIPFKEEAIHSEQALAGAIRRAIHQPFDLAKGPLLRAALFRRKNDEAVLLVTIHHLVTDGWSMGVMIRDFAAYYRAFTGGGHVPLAELEIQYADFAEWQREQVEQLWGGQLQYWKERLQGPLPKTALPADFPGAKPGDGSGATEYFLPPPVLLGQLKRLGEREGATLFMTLLAAFKVLIYRYTHQADVIVGSPVAGRNRAEIENLIGFFVNTQVLRTDLSGNPAFTEVLQRVRETTLGAWECQDLPFELLVNTLRPERGLGQTPFFQIMFALQNASSETLELPGLAIERMDVAAEAAKFDLTLIAEETPAGLALRLEYKTGLFEHDTILRLGNHYQNLLRSVVENPGCPIDQLPWLSAAERRQLLEDWRGGGRAFPVEETLDAWFGRVAAQAPGRAAASFGGEHLSYAELDARSNRLARHLRALGVGAETLVGLALERSLDLVVAILAILKAGGAYVPLDPAYPARRLAFMVEDSGLALVVSHSAQQAALAETGTAARRVLLDREQAAIDTQPPEPPEPVAGPENAAYVIYTSGSTGQPKGVVVSHANVARLMRASEELFGFGADDVWTLFHSYAFDFSVWELWGALLYGGRLVVVPFAASRSPELFYQLLADERVTVLNQTPSAFYPLMAEDAARGGAGLALRQVVFGGEALDLPRLRPWLERHGEETPRLVNMYGITETTVHVTYRRVRLEDTGAGRGSVIGRPLPDLAVYVLDAAEQPAPAGVAGELHVGGAGLARGYLRRDGLTAERFVANPFAEGRLYKTGDLARWLGGGELEYLGRIDSQVKIRGFRIELGEIEQALRAAGGLREAAVLARPGPSGQPRLVAYGAPRDGATPRSLRQACEARLPDYMVPSAYVLLDALPLTANGKLDRDAMPDPEMDLHAVHEDYAAPGNETEAALARIWAEVLGLERVGVHDNFFALGGDSIIMLQIVAKAARAGLKISRRNLMAFQTIAELAATVSAQSADAPLEARSASAGLPTQRVEALAGVAPTGRDIEDAYPLSPLQQGLLFHALYSPEQDVYLEQIHAELAGEVDLAAFTKAWQTVVARHAVLRTSFVWQGVDEPLQRVERAPPFQVDYSDWRTPGADGQNQRLADFLEQDRRRGFDLGAAPLTRVSLIRLAEDRWHWVWTHHHLVLDGWCVSVVVGEVLAAYEAWRLGTEPRLPPRRPYRDYIAWLGRQDQPAAEAFWRQWLAGFDSPTRFNLPERDSAERQDRVGQGEALLSLGEQDTAQLQAWARQQQITLNTVVAGAWAYLLHAYSGGLDVVFGVTVAGRPEDLDGFEDMVGLFINTLPMRVKIDRQAPLSAWLRDTQARQASLRDYESSRLADIQRWSGLPPGGNLFETLLVFENYPVDQTLKDYAGGLSFGPVSFVERSHYGLALAAIPGGNLALKLYFDENRYEIETIRPILGHLRQLLLSAAAGQVETLADWDLFEAAERRRLREAGGTATPYPAAPAHQIIEEQACLAPDRIAVSFGDSHLSFRELSRRANRLAHYLRRRGVGPEILVGLYLDRSIKAIISLLAVWKAGGAYLPLDPAYADKRVRFMVEDAGVRLVLTQTALLARFPRANVELLDLDAAWPAISQESDAPPAVEVGPAHLAYAIYTSGSTGTPKGTLLTHRGLSNLGFAQSDFFRIAPDSRVLQFASLSFDASVSEIAMALFRGASLQLARQEDLLPGEGFVRRLKEQRITHLTMTPSVLAQAPVTDLPDLASLIVAGEACPLELRAQWAKNRAFFNAYGPTEATVCASLGECAEGRLHIGKALANARLYVLDADGRPMPAGVPGELHVGGIGLARGYLRRPAMTAERFVPDAYSEEPGARLYKTGDRVRRLPDGNLEFLGRIDRQVKIRGHRIELEEIEQVLRQHGGLREAAVLARPGPAGQPSLVAYGVAATASVNADSLRAVCQDWLPDYMAPAAYVLLAALPLSPTGKLDRDALPVADFDRHTAREAYLAPSNDHETALAQVWREVLGVERVGVEDNFFALGGDSIISLQIVSKAAQAGLKITPREVFQHPTVAELARLARRESQAQALAEPSAAAIPLTPIQHWFFEQRLAHPGHWNQAVLLQVAPEVSAAAIASALAAINRRHGALRLRFDRRDGGWRQRYAGTDGIVLEQETLPAGGPEARREAMARRAEAAQNSLDLEHGPLGRAVFFDGEERHLLVVIHHLAIDGVSWRILLDDLQQHCQQTLLGEPPREPEATASYASWSRKLEARAADAQGLGTDYWLELEREACTPLPIDYPEGVEQNKAGVAGIVAVDLSREETEALLRQVPPVYHTQVNDILLAAFAQAMAAWTGGATVWVNLEGHGRETLFEDVDLSRTVGWFTSLFPVALKTEAAAGPGRAIMSVKEQLRQIPQGGVGFGIARYLSPDAAVRGRLAGLPEPAVSFNYLGQLDQAESGFEWFRLADGPLGAGQDPDEPRRHLLDVVASVQGGQFRVEWHYPTAAYRRETVAALAQRFLAELRGLVGHCLEPEAGGWTPSDFPLCQLDQTALDRVLAEAAGTEDLYSLSPMQQGLLFHSLFEGGPDLYLEQLHGELLGGLDAGAFERAWQETVKRHAIFRTAFVWRQVGEPLQRVLAEAPFHLDREDWRGLDGQAQAARLEAYLSADRNRGLDLEQAPLMRVSLLRLDEARWHWIWTHHHVLLDGWCLSLVVREVLQCYQAFCLGAPPPARRPRPYRDYIAWLSRQDTEQAQAHWRKRLAGFATPTRLNIPPRPQARAAETGPVEVWLDADETARLQGWIRRQQITANTLVLGAWARLLQSYANQEDVVFGVTVSGRPASLAGSAEMIGLFINSLPLRAGSGRGLGLLDWLRALQHQQLEMRDFEHSRLPDVQRCSDVPTGEPLFETLLAFDNYPVDTALQDRFGGLDVRDVRLVERTHFPLALSVVPGGRFKFRALFDGQRYDADSIRRLLEHLRGLLRAAVNDTVQTVDAWALTVEPRRDEPQALLPPLECAHQIFARIAAERGDAIALACEGEHLSYRELDAQANRLANYLQAKGVGPEVLVGLCVERSLELVVGLLGIMKAGGAYVPFDPAHPAERIGFMLEDSRVACLVTQAPVAARLGDIGVDKILLDADAIAQAGDGPPRAGVQAANAAYVIYTSGSTGRPKGCLVTHANLARLMARTQAWYGFDANDVWTLFHSAAFDFSVWEIWGALLHGGRLVVVPYASSRSPDVFYELVEREGVTVLNQTPSAFRQFMAVDETRPGAKLALRQVIFGGEALQLESLRGWFQRHGDQRPLLVNMYGITETTVHVTYRPIRLADLDAGAGSVIGAAIPDLHLHVLDVYQQPMPEGLPGELFVAGAGVARGYLRRPGLTAERMIPNPFGPGRLYRTGDLARVRADGLEYLGRVDEQVKIRGFRIELGEIEAVIAEHPLVRETAVLARATPGGDPRLAAYVVRREADLSAAQLRAFLSGRLPDYMLPAAFVFLDAMPLTGNGKTNRAALPNPDEAGESPSETYTAPRNPAEHALAAIWREVLGVAQVGVHDNFFALGGDSIRSIRVLARTRELGLDCGFQDLVKNPTIAELAAGAGTGRADQIHMRPFGLVSEAVKAQLPETVEDAYPLTLLQQGMFFHSGFEAGASAYHDVMSYHLRAPYDPLALRDALAQAVARHGILRTSFHFGEYPEPLQLVHRQVELPFAEADLRGLGAAEQQTLIRAWAAAESSRPFAWDQAPLLRVQIHRRGGDSFQFGLSVHHAILDGWSVASLLAECFQHYARNLGRPVALPPPMELSFRDFVALERQVLASDQERAFWADYLADAPFAHLPRLASGDAPPGHKIARAQVPISAAASDGLKRLAGLAGAPLRAVLLAAHMRALAFITNQADAVTGLVANGRLEQGDGDRTLGLFLNTVPFRLQARPGTWLELVRQTSQSEQAISPHRRYPLSEIQKLTGGEPLFEVDFNFVHFHVFDQALAAAGGDFTILDAETFEETNFTLAVNFSVLTGTGRIAGALDYDATALSASQIQAYAAYYGRILDAMAAEPEARHERLDLLSVDERRRQLVDFQGDTPAVAEPAALHQLVEAQVGRSPDAIALAMDGVALSYAGLNRRANRLAHALRRLGVGPDTLVGVGLDSSPERVVALLAILKAGGAYLPLDPGYPAQRLAWMVEDSRLAHLITAPGVLPEGLPAVACRVFIDEAGLDGPDANLNLDLHPDNLAYTLYTSGSTGRPKGAQITHRAIVNHMRWMQRAYPLTPADRVLQKTPFSFDASVWEFWAPLMSGALLSLAEGGGQQDPGYLVKTLREQAITTLQLVPTLLEALLAEDGFAACQSLRRVYAGGEALRPELARQFHAALPAATLINLYGPTETAIDATSQVVANGAAAVPIGRPIDHLRAYVLDGQFELPPLGTDGEIFIGGAGLGRGYLRRPGLTAERFLPDPYAAQPGRRLYRTGDLGRWLPDGGLEFRGRADHQVKLRGFRIELGEIESVLASYPGVKQAAAAIWPAPAGGQRLAAYLVPETPAALSRADVRQFLGQRLPDYMVPAAFVLLDALPRTPSGKLDRKALPSPEQAESVVRRAYVAPRDEAETALAGIWAGLLGVEPVGVEDNFYELGGDSILSLQIVSRARQAGWKISPKQILQGQTVARVAAQAERVGGIRAEQAALAGEVPLSPIQQDFFARGLANPQHWNQSMLLRVPPDFSVAAFNQALQATARHHDALRLRFELTDAGWRQAYAEPSADLACLPLDLSALPPDGQIERLSQQAGQLQAGLDLSAGSLLRAAYFNFGLGQEGRLLLAIHHLAVDGVSWRVLLEDLLSAYRQAAQNQPIRLPEKTASFRSWVERLQAHAESANPAFWLDLEAASVRPLPVDAPAARADNPEAAVLSVRTRLDADYTRALLHDLPRLARAQLDEVLLAVLAETLAEWTGGDALWLDLEGHGREDLPGAPDISRTVGWFTSLFPIQLPAAQGQRANALLRKVKGQLRAMPNKGLDFGVSRYLSADPSIRARLAALPARELCFNYLGRFDSAEAGGASFRPASEAIGHDHAPENQRPYLLDILARVVDGALTVEWFYAGRAYQAGTIERLADAYMGNLRDLIVQAEACEAFGYVPSDFPLANLSQSALDSLLAGRGPVADVLPLSPLQEGLLFHALDDGGHGEYLQQITALIDGVPEQAAFGRAWNRVLQKHPALRASFHGVELSSPKQIIHAEAACPVAWLDWREMPKTERENRWQALLADDRRLGLDPAQAPLMRVQMIRVAARQWRLLWTHHHLILDGWSLPLVLQAVQAFYRQELAGAAVDAPPPRPYADYIAWLQDQDRAEAQAYWRDTLKGYTQPNAIVLPAPGASGGAEFAEVGLALPESLTAQLAAFAQTQHVTLNTVVQGIWALLLATYSQQADVVFGVTVSGRPAELAGIEQTVGLFINSLPLRINAADRQPLAGFLREIQARQTALGQYEYSRLVDVQGWSELARDVPLFDTLFIFENYPMGEAGAASEDGFSVSQVATVERTHYPLTCLVLPGRELNLKLVYQTARFSDAAMRRWLEQARTLAEAVLRQPQAPLAAFSPLGGPERRRLLHDWNDTAEAYDAADLFHHRFSRQARRTPDACAVVFGGEVLSYGELEARANQLSHYLRARGIGPDTLVGVHLERSADLLVGLLGILKAGGAYVPLDPRFPQERLAMMVEDSAAPVILTQAALAGTLASHGAKTIRIDADWPAIAQESRGCGAYPVWPENLAYTLFTSGSTGRPKGVKIPHRALTNLLLAFERRVGLDAGDVMLAVTTLSFDIAGLELWLPLMAGARLVVASAEDAADGDRLATLLREEEATVMQATPATWRLLLTTGWTPGPSLRMWCGGEALPVDLAQRLTAHGHVLWNVYGPTETTIWSTVQRVETEADARSIGRPISNTTVYLVDGNFQPVPIGVPGELLIGGDGVAQGYAGQPTLTAEKFVPDPFSAQPGAVLYRTGDQARYRDSGQIEFLGRLDTQAKIRGFRIELGEIETALRRDPDVREAAVRVREDQPGQQRLVAYLVLANGARRAGFIEQIRALLRERLPDYMVPAAYVDLDALPLTPNGKTDYRALPAPDASAHAHDAYVAPRNALEEVLVGLWKDTLGVDRVGVTDNFFTLGGHSLVAAQILAWLRQAFKVNITLRSLFAATTVERLADVLTGLEPQPERLRKTAEALLKIKAMSPEERARRLKNRQSSETTP